MSSQSPGQSVLTEMTPNLNHLPGVTVGVFDRARRYIEPVEASMLDLVDNHCSDPLNAILKEHLTSGGRRLRALLALAVIDTLGAEIESGIGWAAACELLHNATLIHDDLQDGDEMRRGRPTIWFSHGVAHATNAGDLLLIAPVLAVGQIQVTDMLRWQLVSTVARYAALIASGQAAELKMTAEGAADLCLYRRVVTQKTSGLFELPVQGAALLAGYDDAAASLISRVFRPLGVLFQMQDDVLDLFGNKGRQQVGSDLREGKISALVVHHLQLHPNDAPWLSELLNRSRGETGEDEILKVIERFRCAGALKSVINDIHQEADAVRTAATALNCPGLLALVSELIELVLAPIRNTIDSCRSAQGG